MEGEDPTEGGVRLKGKGTECCFIRGIITR